MLILFSFFVYILFLLLCANSETMLFAQAMSYAVHVLPHSAPIHYDIAEDPQIIEVSIV